jgi:hypothetical protein
MATERDLQSPSRPSTEFAPRLDQHAERADGMEHSSATFYVLLIPFIERSPQSVAPQVPKA